jgi:competence protein ComGC
MNRKRAVTLVELLIVITVFVITFILLTPVVNKMRQRANIIKCSNNIRLISIALHMYAADHKENFPPDLKSLYPNYIKEEKVFNCPAAGVIGTVEKPGYEYVAGLTESSQPTEIIVYDRDGDHQKIGRNILRVNGSVGWVRSTEGKPR